MKGAMGDLMQQAQKMQAELQKAQEEIAQRTVQGEAGAGLVTVTMNGRHDVSAVHVDPSVLTEEKEMLEDLLAAAGNDAGRKVEASNQEAMRKVAGGMPLPAGFKFPFS